MENEDFGLPGVHATDGIPVDGGGKQGAVATDASPDPAAVAEPDRKKARTDNPPDYAAHNEGQQQMHPIMHPSTGVYPPMGWNPMMMMMSPQMYGYPPPHPPYGNAAAAPYGSPTNEKSKKGTKEEGKEAGTTPQPSPSNAQMYNPYMMQMQQFHGMMNPYYGRPGYPFMFNQQNFGATAPAQRGISLALSIDAEMLSEYQLLVRQQLELFEAGPEDVESNTQGRKKQVVVGQVGLRCKHCSPLPIRARGRGAVYYPAKLNGECPSIMHKYDCFVKARS